MLHMLGLERYPAGFTRTLADHIATFSLGGMAAVGKRHAR
jgi:hypothetical protein